MPLRRKCGACWGRVESAGATPGPERQARNAEPLRQTRNAGLEADTCRHEWRHGTSGDVRHVAARRSVR